MPATRFSQEHLAALTQAEASIGCAVEILAEANIFGAIADDLALLGERLALIMNKYEQDHN